MIAATPSMNAPTGLYTLPLGLETAFESPIGTVKLRTASGYFGGRGIFVYLPPREDGLRWAFPHVIAAAFLASTKGQFHLDPAPGNNCGGDSTADALITAGLDLQARCRDPRRFGYFTRCDAPRLDEVVRLLTEILNDHHDTLVERLPMS